MNDFNSNLAINMKLLRARQNLKLTDLQRMTGLSLTTLSNIENGKRKVQTQTLYKIASALNVSVDYLIKEKEGKEND